MKTYLAFSELTSICNRHV